MTTTHRPQNEAQQRMQGRNGHSTELSVARPLPPGTLAPLRRSTAEAGMATAEYAIGTVAAAAFAGLLLVILRSDAVRSALQSIITSALSVG